MLFPLQNLPILGMVLETEDMDMQRGRETSRTFGNPTGVERQKLEFGAAKSTGH